MLASNGFSESSWKYNQLHQPHKPPSRDNLFSNESGRRMSGGYSAELRAQKGTSMMVDYANVDSDGRNKGHSSYNI